MASIQVGQVFTRLTALKEMQPAPHAYWFCTCECGHTAVISAASLNSGGTRSCGCLQKELTIARSTTHNESYSIEYKIWQGILQRCINSNANNYKYYGGRGIKVCERWLNSFPNFLEDMGRKPTSDHSIERDDVNGNYEKSNCRWATMLEQANNKTNSRFIENINGEIQTISQVAKANNISIAALHSRIRRGMTPKDAIIYKPVKKHYECDGTSLTLGEWSKRLNIPRDVLYGRINKHNWTPEKALTTPLLRQ